MTTSHWIASAPTTNVVRLFQLEMSVDQKLTLVTEAIDGDVAQAMACLNCFHAQDVTQQRSTFLGDTILVLRVLMKPTVANKDSRKKVPHRTDAEKRCVTRGDNTDRAAMPISTMLRTPQQCLDAFRS